MPKTFVPAEPSAEDLSGGIAFAPLDHIEPEKPQGTVLMPFNGPTRRFKVDYVVTEADIPDLPMSMDDLRAAGLIA